MSTRGNNPDPQASRNAARPAAPGSGGMVMLAGSAAGRMVQAILARLAGPHAGPTARPLRPAVLWQHVARRLGYVPPASTPLGTASAAAPPRPPAMDLVWRVRPVAPPQDAEIEEAPLYPTSAFPSARPAAPASPVASPALPPSSGVPAPPLPASYAPPLPPGNALPPASYAPPLPPGNIAPPASYAPQPPGRAAFVPPAPSMAPRFVASVAPAPPMPVAAPAPSAPVQRVPLWEQVARPPVVPAAPPAPPIALARQVAYRMGQDVAPPSQPGFTILGPASVPETPFVWRTRPATAPPVAADAAPPAAPAGPRGSLPPGAAVLPPIAGSAGAVPPPQPVPVQRLPAATANSAPAAGTVSSVPAAPATPPSSVQVGYTPGPALVPAAPLVTAPVLGGLAPLLSVATRAPAPVPARPAEELVWRVRPAAATVPNEPAYDEPAPRWAPGAAPPPSVHAAPAPALRAAPVETAPSAEAGAPRVVRLAYTPPPPPAPLWAGPTATLATELNRDLVAPGDLLARPARTWDQEPVAVPPRAVEAALSAPEPADLAPLTMPLAAPARAVAPLAAPAEAADLPVAAANPGLFSRLVDRVTAALPLPEPIRHALESLAARPAVAPSTPPAEAAPVPSLAQPSLLAVEVPGAAPLSAPAVVDSAPAPAAPMESGGPLVTEPDGLPATLVAAPDAAPVPAAEVRPAPAPGGFLSALVSRLLGGTVEPSAPTAGPAPLDMPWVRRAAPPAGEADAAVADEIASVAEPPPAAASAISLPAPVAPASALAPAVAPETPGPMPGAAPGVPAPPVVPALPVAEAVPPAAILSMPGTAESAQMPVLPVESRGPLPAVAVAAPAAPPAPPAAAAAGLPAAPAARSEPTLIPPAPAPLVAPQPVSGLGGFLSAIVNRVLGTTPAPPAPVAGPAPLDMPWARRPAAPAVEEDSAGEYEPAPAPLSVQRAVAAPPAPPAGPTAVAALPPTAAAPVADSGPAVAMPAVPTSGDPFAVPVPGDLPAVPAAPAWVSTPAPAFDQTAGELAEAPVAQPWMDLDSLGDVLARVQTPLVPTAGLSTAGQGGLWRRIVGAFERALPGGGAPAAPMTLAWSGGSPATTGAGAAPFVPAQPGGYSAPSAGSAAPWPAYGPGAGAWIPAAGPGGAALLAGRLPADFGVALGPHALTPAAPVPYFDAESAGDADAEVGDAAQAWIAALDRMYGAPAAGSETMPLAVPYGGFVVPAAGASGVLPQDLAWVAETIGLESAPPTATPARRVWERPVAGAPAPPSWAGGQGPGFVPPAPGWIGDTGSAEYDSEAAAWADVVAAAVESDYGAGVPALALAGEEQGVPAVQDAPSGADHEAAGDAAGDLDELANSVYEIIRRRLEVERERDWA